MKITAHPVDRRVVELHCKPWFGKPYIIYALKDSDANTNQIVWYTLSGRMLNNNELRAIEKLPIYVGERGGFEYGKNTNENV